MTAKWSQKAKQMASSLKAEFEAGKNGDESPITPIWSTPKQQLDWFLGLLRAPRATAPEAEDVEVEVDAEEVAVALRRVDWSGVRAATAGRSSEVTKSMRSMAEHVDWAKVQPMAAQVSSALIAAVAAGQIPVGGRLGPIVARTIADQGGRAQQVGEAMREQGSSLPPDFRDVIDTTARDA
jgi:hypothetical protein